MASQRSQPFFRTRRAKAGDTKEDRIHQVPSTSQKPSSLINEFETASPERQSPLIPGKQAAEKIVARVNEETRKSNGLRAPNLPQEDGFIAVFIEVCSWQADFRSEAKRRRGQKSAYAGRIGYQQPLGTTKIGEGATFSVFKRYDNGSLLGRQSKLVVMKDSRVRFAKDGQATERENLNSLRTEIRVLSHPPLRNHPNIVKLLDLRWDHPDLDQVSMGPTLYLEYADFGTLTDYFTAFQPPCTFKSVASCIIKGIWDGLHALHQCRIVHGDLKPNNVLVFREGERVIAKLSDFGCSILLSQQTADKATLRGFSPPWDAPEAGNEVDIHLLEKTDVYSFGLTYWWVRLGGRDPFALKMDGNDGSNPFGLSGTQSSKPEALKKLKQSRDFSSDLQNSVLGFQDARDEFYSNLKQEVRWVADHTLLVNATDRILGGESDMHPFAEDSTYIPPVLAFSEAKRPVWTSASPWLLPLRYDPDEKTPSKRFIQVAQRFASAKSNARVARKDVGILLIRSHLEGFGVPRNFELAAGFLEDTAQLGESKCQSMLRLFLGVIGTKTLAKTDNFLYNAAMEQRTIISLEDKSMLSEEQLLTEFQKPNTYNEIDPWLGHSLAGRRMSLIHHAAARGWWSVIEVLLRSDSKWDCHSHLLRHDSCGYTPFLYACRYGHSEVALRLLEISPSEAIMPNGEAPQAFYLLPNLLRQANGQHARLRELADKLLLAGANPNQKSLSDCREELILGTISRIECENITWQQLGNPLSYAIWRGDLDVVQCLLDVGAIPDLLCLHLATALHRCDILRILLSSTAYKWPLMQDCSIAGQTILETAMLDAPVFHYFRRIIGTRTTLETSLPQTVDLILSQNSNSHRLMSTFILASRVLQCCRLGVRDPNLVKQLLSPEESHFGHNTTSPELIFTAVAWNNAQIVEHLLSVSVDFQDPKLFSALHVCAIFPVSPKLCQVIHKSLRDIDIKQKNKPISDLETPFQFAVACQNVEVADFLFENGASKDEIITSTAGYLENCSLLGWLIPITWTESQGRIRYLFERYSAEPVPQFLVRPEIGRSALQEAAGKSLKSEYEEQDMRDLMQYLITKYPGSRHLEYQRIDNSSVILKDAKHSGIAQSMVNGKTTMTENTYHFNQRIRVYLETKDKKDNGTALHFAVRSINYPAVCVLLEAGADVSAMIGLPLSEFKFSTSTKGASTYATKENCWASTVLDFASLVCANFEDEPVPPSLDSKLTGDSHVLYTYQKERSESILKLLQQKGAANSTTFLRKFKERKIFKTRREKGNLAALSLFNKDLRDGLSNAREVYKTTKKEAKKIQSVKIQTPEATKLNFANQLLREGRLDEAMKLYLEIQAQDEQVPLSGDSAGQMALYVNMGLAYAGKGEYVKSEMMYTKALNDQMKWLGRNHSDTLHTMRNIAELYRSQEKWNLAEEWVQKALQGQEKEFGPEDPRTLETVMAHGSIRIGQERFEEAEAIYQRALAGLQPVSGPALLTCYHNLGIIYKYQSKLKESKAMLQNAVNGRDVVHGVNHHDTIGSVEQLGLVLDDLNELDEAIVLLSRALIRFQEQFNFDDCKITRTAWRLGGLYLRKKDFTASMRMYQICLQGEEARLGPDHADVLTTMLQIGVTFTRLKEYEKAVDTYNGILEAKARTPNSEDQNSLHARWNLACLFRDPNLPMYDLSTARGHYELATEGYTALLGTDSDDALKGCFKLGDVCKDLNDLSAAKDFFKRAQEGFERKLGSDHEKTLDAMDQLACILYMLDDYVRASSLLEKVLEQRKGRLSSSDPTIVRILKSISNCRSMMADQEPSAKLNQQMRGDEITDSSASFNPVASVEAATVPPGETLSNPGLVQEDNGIQSRKDEWMEQLVQGKPAHELNRAVVWGSESFQTLISKGATTESRDQDGLTALLWAVVHQRPADVSLLIDMGADVNALDPVGHTPMHFACRYGDKSIISRLLLAGTEIAAQDNGGSTIIHHAMYKGDPHSVRVFLDSLQAHSQCDLSKIIDLKNHDGLTALHIACSEGHLACVEILLERGANIGQPESQGGLTPIMLAVVRGHEDVVTLLLMYGVETDSVSAAGHMAIHSAASNGNVNITQKLLDHGANVDAQSLSNDTTPLFWAVGNDHIATAKCLLRHRARVNAKDMGSQTAMHIAASRGNTAMMQLLLENGADFGANDDNFSKPLHSAAYAGHLEAARLLLIQEPLDVHAKDRNGSTPLGLAAAAGHAEMVGALIDSGALLDLRDLEGSTALHVAAARGLDAVVRRLLEGGADVTLRDREGRLAGQLAAMGDHGEVVASIEDPIGGKTDDEQK